MGKANAAAHLAEYKWQSGVSPNPAGRPKGSRAKLSELAAALLYENFTKNGAETIERVRQRKPEVYLASVIALLPKQAQKVDSPFVDISDAELEALEQHLAAVRSKLVQTIEATATETLATTETAPTIILDGQEDAPDTATEPRDGINVDHVLRNLDMPEDDAA